MTTQLAKCEPSESGIIHQPIIREVKIQHRESKSTPRGLIWNRLCGFVEWFLSFSSADDGIETWRRLEFRNEYQERREPKMLDIHRWY